MENGQINSGKLPFLILGWSWVNHNMKVSSNYYWRTYNNLFIIMDN